MFDSSGKPAAPPGISDSCATGGSVTEFDVGRATSCELGADATVNAPMDHESSMSSFYFYIRRHFSRFSPLLFLGPAEVPVANFVEVDISTEAETKRQRRSRSAGITRRLVPLAQNASASIDFPSREHRRTLLEQAFDDGMYQLK